MWSARPWSCWPTRCSLAGCRSGWTRASATCWSMSFRTPTRCSGRGWPRGLSGYAGSGGGSAAPSVFIVGDPKQSIYRFRRAEPQVFIAAQAFVRDGLRGDLLSCDHTRRNAQGVIAAVNAVMGQAQAQNETTGFRDHTTESKHPGQLLRLPAITDADEDSQGAGRNPLAWRDSLTEPRHEAEETQRMRECTQAAAWVAAQIAA